MFRHILMPRCITAVTAFQKAALTTGTVTRAFSSAAAPNLLISRPQQLPERFLQRLKLNMLQDNPGATKEKRRKGRGVGSGRGKTSCRGHNGQKSRGSGKVGILFNGGAVKYWKQLPKRGFNNRRHAIVPQPINLRAIALQISMKRLDASQPIDLRAMQLSGLFKPRDVKHGVKLLAFGENLLNMHPPLHIVVNRASTSAIRAVERRGGTVKTVHMNRLALRTVLRPQKYINKILPRHARPPPKYQPYYTSWKKRGYLHPAVQMRSWFAKSEENKAMEDSFRQILKRNSAALKKERKSHEATAAAATDATTTDDEDVNKVEAELKPVVERKVVKPENKDDKWD